MQLNRYTITSACLLVLAMVSGCATPVGYEGARFLSPPNDISSAWIAEGGAIFIVPEKGVVIDAVVSQDGRPVQMRADGAYYVIPANQLSGVTEIRFMVEQRWRRLPISRKTDAKG